LRKFPALFDRSKKQQALCGVCRSLIEPGLCANLSVRSNPMLDIAVLAIGLVFFALSIAYVYACDAL
jgi:hypothetical protein